MPVLVASTQLGLTAVGVGLRASLSLVSLLNVVLLARALGPTGRGEYFLFVAAVALLARVADLGMSPSAVVFASRRGGAVGSVHRQMALVIVSAWLVLAAIGFVTLSLFSAGFGDLAHERALLALGVLPLAMYEQLWLHLMVGLRRVVAMNVVQLCGGVAALVLNFLLVALTTGGVEAAVAIYCGLLVLKTPLMFGLMVRTQGGAAATPVPWQELLSFGLRSYPNAVANLLWTRLPAFVLDFSTGAAAVGIFSIAQQVLEQLVIPVQAAQDAIYRNMARLPRVTATAAMNRYLRVGLWCMAPVLVCAALGAPWAISVIVGGSFGASGLVLRILLLSAVATSASALLSPYFFGQLQRPELASAVAWSRLVVALSLSVVLAPHMAEIGVAVALVAADVCATLLMLALYVRIAGTPIQLALLPRRADFALLGSPIQFRARQS